MCLIGMMLVASSAASQPVTSAPAAVQSHRKLLQFSGSGDRVGNNVRAQSQTQQAILAAVDRGASLGQTRRAAEVGSATSWAVGQREDVFNTVERATAPSALGV